MVEIIVHTDPMPDYTPAPTVADVKHEAERRILSIMPEYKQRNALALFAETVQTHGVDPSGWPQPLQATNDAIMGAWSTIKAIRAKSDAIEAMDPIPSDFAADKHW